jgi:hypothetical protein
MEESFGESSKKLNVFEKIFHSLTHPDELFKTVRSEPFTSSFLYVLLITAIPALLKFVLFLVGIKTLGNESIFDILVGYIITIVVVFIATSVYHVFAKLFGGVSDYDGTFKAYVYGFTPSILFGWIPVLGLIGAIYGIYLFIKGLSILHGLSTGKSFLVWFIPVLILLLIVIFLIILLGVAVISYLAGLYSQNPELLNYLNETGEVVKVLKKM